VGHDESESHRLVDELMLLKALLFKESLLVEREPGGLLLFNLFSSCTAHRFQSHLNLLLGRFHAISKYFRHQRSVFMEDSG
jgi:hypothetical protein